MNKVVNKTLINSIYTQNARNHLSELLDFNFFLGSMSQDPPRVTAIYILPSAAVYNKWYRNPYNMPFACFQVARIIKGFWGVWNFSMSRLFLVGKFGSAILAEKSTNTENVFCCCLIFLIFYFYNEILTDGRKRPYW